MLGDVVLNLAQDTQTGEKQVLDVAGIFAGKVALIGAAVTFASGAILHAADNHKY